MNAPAERAGAAGGAAAQSAPAEAGPRSASADAGPRSASADAEWPLWEVFVRARSGLDHKHCGSLHASDAQMALQLAREVYTRRQEGTSIWVVRSSEITASDPGDKDMFFDPMEDKVYRHPTFYPLPQAVDQM